MNYRVVFTTKSVGDLGDHATFVNNVSKEAAAKLSSHIIASAQSLAQFPERFPEFAMPGVFPVVVRKCVVDGRYIILFGTVDNTVMVYRVLDARRKFDGLLV